MTKLWRIPLSLAAVSVLGLASFDVTVTSGGWKMIGSGKGVDIDNLIGSYNTDTLTSACANNALISAWRYDASLNKWLVRNCNVDAVGLGYTDLTSTSSYEGTWIHGSSTGGTVTANEVLADDGTEMTVYSGWTMLSMGGESITFSTNNTYEIFKDKGNQIVVWYFDGSSWSVYTPNDSTITGYTTLTSLSANAGFWVSALSDKTYNITSDDDTDVLDKNDSIIVAPGQDGDGSVDITQSPVSTFPEILTFPTSSRYSESQFDGLDTNVSRTSLDLKNKTMAVIRELNESSGAYSNYYVGSALDSLVFGNTNSKLISAYNGTISATGSKALITRLYEDIMSIGYAPDDIKSAVSDLYIKISDLNRSLNLYDYTAGSTLYSNNDPIGDGNTTAQRLGNIYFLSTDYNTKAVAANWTSSAVAAKSAQQTAFDAASTINDKLDTLATTFSSTKTSFSDLSTAASALYSLILEENSSATKSAVWQVTTEGAKEINESNKTLALTLSAFAIDQTFVTDSNLTIRLSFYDASGVNLDSSTGYIEITDANSSKIYDALVSNIGDQGSPTGGSSGYATYLHYELPASYADICSGSFSCEFNVSANPGVGDITMAASFIYDGVSEFNATTVGSTPRDWNITTVNAYVAPANVVSQVGKITLGGEYKVGDEINISMTTTNPSYCSDVIWNAIEQPNYRRFVVAESDIGSTDSQTLTNLASKIATSLDTNDTNGTWSASSNVITVTPSTTITSNASYAYCGYDFDVNISGINYSNILTLSDYAKTATTALEGNFTAFVDTTSGSTISSLETNLTTAYNAVYSVVYGTGTADGTVYIDDLTKLYWNLDGVSTRNECTTSSLHAKKDWRLPTVLEIISLFDSTTSEVASTISSNSSSAAFGDSTKYIATSNTDSSGNYYAVALDGMSVTTVSNPDTNSSVNITCASTLYDNGDATYEFDDFFYTGRLSLESPYIDDSILNVYWERKMDVAQVPKIYYDTWTDAKNYCEQVANMSLPTAEQLRSLYLYNLKAVYDDNLDAGGLNRSGLFVTDFNNTTDYYWTSSTDSSGNYYIINPGSEESSYSNMFNTTSSATTSATGYRVICVKNQ